MASTYVNDLRLNEMATGDGSGTWGTTTNTNLELIGEALGYGTEGITTNADTHTSTIADGATDPVRAMYVEYTGTLDSACTITIAPNTVNRMQFIENGTSGSQNIIISQGSGANITIPPGDVKAVYLDGAGSGAAVVDAFASLNVVDLKVQDDLTVTDDATIGGTLGVTGIVTLTDDLIIGDGKTIGSASDVDAMTIAANGQITLTQTLIGTALDISGDIDVDGTTNLDVVDIDGAVNMATTALVTGVLTTTAATVFNGGFASNADSTMGTDKKVQFRDAAIYINSSADGQLDLVADTEIQIAATTIDINGAINASGEIIAASLDISGNVDIDGVLETDNLTVGGAQGTDGQVLTSTGSGVGWEDASGGATSINGLSDAKTFGTSSLMLGDATTGTIDAANFNVGLGVDVFAALTSGDDNVAIGFAALAANTTGEGNIGVGFKAGQEITTGSYSTVIGYDAANGMTTGPSNVIIGAQACDGATEIEKCIMIGRLATHAATNNDSMIVIGYNSTGKGDSTGFINPGGGAVYQGNNATAWAQTSDRRIKKNIVDNNVGLDVINKIRVRNFEYRTLDEIVDFDNPKSAVVEQEGVQLGAIAQELEEFLPEVVETTSEGVKSVTADRITWHLVNAVQELTTQMETLKTEISTLKGE